METSATGSTGLGPLPAPEPKRRFSLRRGARFALGAVLVVALFGSILWIVLGWPLPTRLWIALALAAGCSFFGVIALFVRKDLPDYITRALAGGTGLILLIAAVMAVQGAESPITSTGGHAGPETSDPGAPASTPAQTRPSTEADPLVTTLDFDLELCENYVVPESLVPSLPKKNTGFDPKWIYQNGGATHYGFELTVQGKTSTAVVVKRFRVVNLKRNPVPPDPVHVESCGPSGGAVTVRQFDVSLSDPAKFTPVPGQDPVTGEDVPAVDFPFKVTENDPEVFLLTATGTTCFCEWRLAIDWTSGGRTGTTVIDRGFGPIKSDVNVNNDPRPLYYFENGKWQKESQ
jgi:hypothetical protein